jgi:prepilin-type N-terminal cleavage/methylation domain-containing protein
MNFNMRERSRESGFTILELIVAMVLLGAILAALFGTITRTQRRYVEHKVNTRSHETLGMAEATLIRLFRSARAHPTKNTLLGIGTTFKPGITPNPLNHATWDNVAIRSDFNPADGDFDDIMEDVQFHTASDTLFVRWQSGGATTAMAYPVRSILFSYYSSGGVQILNPADVTGAARVKFVITVPEKPGAPLLTRTTWATVRN